MSEKFDTLLYHCLYEMSRKTIYINENGYPYLMTDIRFDVYEPVPL